MHLEELSIEKNCISKFEGGNECCTFSVLHLFNAYLSWAPYIPYMQIFPPLVCTKYGLKGRTRWIFYSGVKLLLCR